MNQHPLTPTNELEETVDLQDMLLTLAENLRVLIIGPLLIGALTYGATYLWPQTYESLAIVQAEAPIASYMTTAKVLDAVLKSLGYVDQLSEEDLEDERTRLKRNITTQIGRNDKLILLSVKANSPTAAQQMATVILESTFVETRPKSSDLKKLQEEEAFLKQQIDELKISSETLQKAILQASPTQDLSRLIESRSTLSDSMIQIQISLHLVQTKMEGLTSSVVLQSPTLPIKPIAPRKAMLAALSTLGSAILLLMYVFLKQSWQHTKTNARNQERLLALRKKYGLTR